MDRDIRAVISELREFVPADEDENIGALYKIFTGFSELPDRASAAQEMFALLERFPEGAFGSPGPLVHELEKIENYQLLLVASLEKQPTEHTVWMANRVLNSKTDKAEREHWLTALSKASVHPNASEAVQASANDFVEFYLGRRHV